MQYLLLSTLKGKVLVGAIIGALAWGVGFALYSGSLLESYELRTYDQLCRFKATYSSSPQEIVLVAVDQGSLEAARSQGINWPWPRQMYAPILQFCAAAGARAVVFDILFTEPSSYGLEDDRVFADAVKENGRAVLALFLARQDRPHPEGETALIRKNAFPLRINPGKTARLSCPPSCPYNRWRKTLTPWEMWPPFPIRTGSTAACPSFFFTRRAGSLLWVSRCSGITP